MRRRFEYAPSPPPWLERACGGLTLLLMLILLALTIGSPADAAPAPIIIVPTRALNYGAVLPLPARLPAPARRVPPDTIEAPAAALAREAPVPVAPPVQQAPALEVLAAPQAVQEAAPATAAIVTSPFIVEPDGTIRLPGVEDWMKNLPPHPTAVPRPTADAPPPPRGGCAARRGCP